MIPSAVTAAGPVSEHDFSRAETTRDIPGVLRWCSPGLQSGGAGFQTRENAQYINFGALALVAALKRFATSHRIIYSKTCRLHEAPPVGAGNCRMKPHLFLE